MTETTDPLRALARETMGKLAVIVHDAFRAPKLNAPDVDAKTLAVLEVALRLAHQEQREQMEKIVKQTADEMDSAVSLSLQFGTPVADRQLIVDWSRQLRAAIK